MPGLKLKITTAGRHALINAKQTGTQAVTIAAVGLTSAAFVADAALTALPSEIKRLTTIGGVVTAKDTMHVSVRDESNAVYSCYGFGLYLADGTLFAAYGQPALLVEKSGAASVLLAIDVVLADVDTAQITFGDTNFTDPAATVDVPGVVRLSTDAQAIEGLDKERAVSPANLIAVLNARLGDAAPTEFIKGLLARPTAAAARNMLGLRSAATFHVGTGNSLDADLLDGQEGAWYRDFRNMLNVPQSFMLPGQIVVMASPYPPTGLLVCDGAAISRTKYAALFAAIGGIYGAGDGSTTFNLPKIKDGTVITHTSVAASVGSYGAGQVISHTHGASAAAVGDHAHYIALYGAGNHSHGASASASGDHAHGAWTDAQGYHAHGGSTSASGDHQHPGVIPSNAINGYGIYRERDNDASPSDGWTGAGGNHAHSIATEATGNHVHNIGMNGAGNHSHSIGIGEGGNHAHDVDHRGAGAHNHAITVNAAGGTDNLPAGLRMTYCIAY
ncbi:phage tail protein [Xanthomonas campestris pv. raphani]|uniref:phage tail protein n=1 Tax=Xanthomonas campestris TaxID=339 RepID=UPI00236802CC|nr:phage tail protein [Xanthomonas campestris]MEA9658763.1 phage tail protein [Xanthomonas campestris pv. raphani]MEA9824601.1 phage tail protein [Xanthomonas campestris pv. raphani]MEA9852977.1 phage tail protein [Xanthomonas campestris pv. raphani]MEA9856871.1 phage tail protein [Xanthomonas campestris pv. raphani]MEA9966053.1 phage tail protein [Xanthomonas campestris pv. raphani]